MSSNPAETVQIDKAGVKLLRDVLRAAGLRGVDADVSSDMKRDALIFLTSQFRDGVRTKANLLKALTRRNRSATVAARIGHLSQENAVELSRDAGGL